MAENVVCGRCYGSGEVVHVSAAAESCGLCQGRGYVALVPRDDAERRADVRPLRLDGGGFRGRPWAWGGD